MPKKITYGVSGLIDWTAVIIVGKARMEVHFTGGALTKYGITPAEFTTSDPITQRIIEQSDYFRSGKISVLRSVGHHDICPASRKCGVEAAQSFENAVLPFDDKPSAPDSQLQVINVACIEDAIDYMRDHHNVPSVRVRNLDALQTVAKQYNLSFNIQH